MRSNAAGRNRAVETVNGAARWQAVQSRDCSADGAFVYAVRSTGIYCRPSCPSRKPRREHVVFFALAEAAEQKGFRPCQRCRPRTVQLSDPRIAAVASVCREIDARVLADPDARLTLAQLSQSAGMSTYQLERAFRARSASRRASMPTRNACAA